MASRINGITIKINGDTTDLKKSLADVNKEIKSTQAALKDVEQLLKLDPKNTELLAQKQELLSKAIEDSKSKLEKLKTAQDQMNADGVDKSSKAYQGLTREIAETQQKITQYDSQLKDTDKTLKDLSGNTTSFKDKLKEMGDEFDSAAKKAERMGEKLTAAGSTLTKTVTGPVVALGTLAVKTAADFDSSMSKVAAISGATGDELQALRDKAREMGSKTKFSAEEAAEAMNYMAMAGWKTEDMLNGIDGIMNLAAASGEDLATTSDIVTDALTAFGLKAEDAKDFSNVLAATAANANTNVAMMGESFKYAAPTAGALGYSIEDVALAIGLMGNAGIKASQAGTSLNNIFTRMAKEPTEAETAMNRLGLSLYDSEGKMYSFREIMEMMRKSFGEINMPLEEFNAKVAALDQELEEGSISESKYDKELEELTKQAYGAEGAEKARAAAMLAGQRGMSGLLAIVNASEEDWNKLSSAVTTASDTLAKTADGTIVPLNEALASGAEIMEEYDGQAEAMANVMNDNLEGQLTILKSQLQELAISMGEILMPIMRELVGFLQGLADKFNGLDEDTKKIILTIAGVAAVIGPILLLLGKVIPVIAAVNAVIAANPIVLIIAGIVAAVALLVAAGVAVYKNWDTIKEKAGELWNGIVEKFTAIKEFFVNAFNTVKETVANVLNTAKETVKEKLNNMKTAFEENGGGIKGAVAAYWEGVKGIYTAGFTFLDKLTGGKLSEIVNMIKDKIMGLVDAAKTWGKDMIDNFVNGIKDKIQAVKDAVTNVANTIKDFLGFSEPDKGPLSNAHTFMPDFIDLLAEGINDNLDDLNQPLNALANKVAQSTQVSVDYNDSKLTGKLDTINDSIVSKTNDTVVKVEMAPNIQNLFRALKTQEYKQSKAMGGV